MDTNLWGPDANEFRPSRFITAENKIHKPEYFMPFGSGRRICLGDVLARMELFIFFASIMHRFDILLPSGCEEPSLDGNPGVTIYPDRFLVCLKERPLDISPDDEQADTPIRPFGSN
jgi:26-hydroxylase